MMVKGNAFSLNMGDPKEDIAAIRERRFARIEDTMNGFYTRERAMKHLSEQLDVDLMMLDFFAYDAVDFVLNRALSKDGSPSAEDSAVLNGKLELVDHFINFFAQTHGADTVPPEIASRVKLLEFSVLFTQRLDPEAKHASIASLDKAREKNKARSKLVGNGIPSLPVKFDPDGDFPLPASELHANRLRLASDLGIASSNLDSWTKQYYGTPTCPSLYDLMPDFFRLTAARAEIDWTATDRWLRLAAEWMVQAVIEAYMMYGASGEDTFREIFAFGCPAEGVIPFDELKDEAVREAFKAMQTLFCDPEKLYEENPSWTTIREDHINALMPEDDDDNNDSPPLISAATLESARSTFEMLGFERNVCGFLTSLHRGMQKPDMVQVAEGRIEGVAEEESRQMLENMGLGPRLTDEEYAAQSRAAYARAGIIRYADDMRTSTDDEMHE